MQTEEPERPDEIARQNVQLTADNEELRRANEALVFSAARYLALHDLAPVPLLTIDRSGHVIDLNHAAVELLGVRREHVIARDLAPMLAGATREAYPGLVDRLFADGHVADLELVVLRDADAIELAVDAIVLPDKGPPRAVLACVDITARKRDEAARRVLAKRADDAQRLESLRVLAGGVAHDFNNLMTVVLGGADVILQDAALGRHADTLTEIREAARHAGDLAHQMLGYSGGIHAPSHAVDVGELVRRLEPLLRACSSATPIVLELPDQPLCVSGDEAQIRQVVLNLVINAAESMHGCSGEIAVAVRAEQLSAGGVTELAAGAYVAIEVRDAGVGMTPETVARIFDPYYSMKFAGRGLGLAVVHGVVRSHAGAMTVTSVPGTGSTFAAYLPATAVKPERSEPAPVRAPALAGTILLVDDDPLVRRLLTRVLGTLGLVVHVADSGATALAILGDASLQIDLVLTDLTMPGMDGVVLTRTIRTTNATLPIVLISGYGALPADAAEMFSGSLSKPFDLVSLRAVLQPLLTR